MKDLSRRTFIRNAAWGTAGLTVFPIFRSLGYSPNNTIRIGFIGLGQQTNNLIEGFNKIPGVQIVAGADVYEVKRLRFEKRVKAFYQAKNGKADVYTCKDYREILDRKDIDAVVIATPDHWHALITLDACSAGKDIYQEKPIIFTIKEGLKVVEAVRESHVIFATGSQQRSDSNYQHAVNMVHRGAIGKLVKVFAYVGPGPDRYDLPEEAVPAGLDWPLWLGPLRKVHYHSYLNPPVSLEPPQNETYWAKWRYYKETGGGFLCDWGAHNFDIGQWGLKKDHSGPVKIIPPGYQGTQYLTFVYDNGLEMVNQPYDDKKTLGIKFWGNDGWIEVSRGSIAASDKELLPSAEAIADNGKYEGSPLHIINFIESVKMRRDPVATVEIGQRTATTSLLGTIALELRRPIHWSPGMQYFINDPEAEKFFHREYENGYQL